MPSSTSKVLAVLLTVALLGCAGLLPPPPTSEPVDDTPIGTTAPEPDPPTIFDREAHRGLPDGVTSWEIYAAVAEPEPSYFVILWGSPDEEEAWKWLERYVHAGGRVRLEAQAPYVVPSKYIEGLNPGFFIIVAAATADEGTAEVIMARLHQSYLPDIDLSGAYVRAVRAPHPETDLDPSDVVP